MENIPVIINADQLMVGRGEFGPVQPWNIGGEQNHWNQTNLISLTKRFFWLSKYHKLLNYSFAGKSFFPV